MLYFSVHLTFYSWVEFHYRNMLLGPQSHAWRNSRKCTIQGLNPELWIFQACTQPFQLFPWPHCMLFFSFVSIKFGFNLFCTSGSYVDWSWFNLIAKLRWLTFVHVIYMYICVCVWMSLLFLQSALDCSSKFYRILILQICLNFNFTKFYY